MCGAADRWTIGSAQSARTPIRPHADTL
jgi:hypothetical protein